MPYSQMLVLEDKESLISPREAYQKMQQGLASQVKSEVPNFAVTDSSFWFYLEINNQSRENDWRLLIEHHLIREVDLYQLKEGVWESKLNSGTAREWKNRIVNNAYFIYPIDKSEVSQRFLLRVRNQDPLLVPLSLITASNLQNKLTNSLWISGLYWGLLIALLAYNAFIYLSTKEKSYLFYVLYVISFAGYLTVHEPWSHQFAFANANWLSNHGIHLSIPLSICFAFLFITHFLRLKQLLPKIYKICNGIILWNIGLLILFPLLESTTHTKLMMVTVLAFSVFVIYIGIVSWRNKNADAPFFLLAWSALIGGAVITNLMYSNTLPFNWFTASASHIGASGEMLLLSFALAASINRVRKQKMLMDYEHQKMLKQHVHQLAQSNQVKDNFLNIISHELRTPLHGIRASLDIVLDKVDDKKVSRELELLDSSAEDMERRITDLLVFTDLGSGKFKLHQQAFKTRDLVTLLDKKFKPLAEDKCLGWQLSYDEHLPEWLFGDKQYLFLIYSQLLDNAIKFSSTGFVSSFFDLGSTGGLLVTIKDTGVGIDESLLEEIDKAFVQADSSLNRDRGGLGLGLTLSKQLIKLMKGKINFDTENYEGTSITVEIPLKAATEEQIEEVNPTKTTIEASRLAANAGDKKILIVEDNHVNRMVLAKMVEHLGHKVSFAENGQLAVNFCRQKAFDLILMDCQMPVMDGITATKKIRQKSLNQNTPIIAITANAMSSDNNICLAAGMNQHLPKPVRLPELTESINRWINSK